MAVHDRFVRFFHGAALPKLPQFLRCLVALGEQHNASGLAVESVDHVGGRLAKVQPHTADQAAVFVALGRVANQVGRLVHCEQLVVLVNDPEHGGAHAVARPVLRKSRNSHITQPEPTDNRPSTENPMSHGVLKSSRPE